MDKNERVNFYMVNAPEMISENGELNEFLLKEGFFTAPASTKYHGVYSGGLFDHSAMVYRELKNLTEKLGLKWLRPESPFIIGMFHDLCKYDQYIEVPGTVTDIGNGNVLTTSGGTHYEYNKNTLLKGHGAKSVMLLSQFITLTEEELLCIRYHMGAYETEEWNEFDRAIRTFPTVLFTHTADMIASKVDDV
jgi:hypothetical protein